jgi:pimeloyl-ACP methyl ester carboxylesterase
MGEAMKILRAFTEIDEGQVHYMHAGSDSGGHLPLVMIPHAAAAEQARLISALGDDRRIYSVELLGMGDSAPPPKAEPGMTDFAEALMRALDALGLDRFDLYGAHQGARAAAEIAVLAPGRVHKLVLDGVGHFDDPSLKADLIDNYMPPMQIDHMGTQVRFVWHYVRDSFLFWPYYMRDAAHALDDGLPSAGVLHDKVVDTLKSARTLHKNLKATFAYPTHERLPKITVPTLVSRMDAVVGVIPDCTQTDHGFYDPAQSTDEKVAAIAASMRDFLDGA